MTIVQPIVMVKALEYDLYMNVILGVRTQVRSMRSRLGALVRLSTHKYVVRVNL
jgi:hypothetical protein